MHAFRDVFIKKYGLITEYSFKSLHPSQYFVPSKIKTTTRPGELAIVIQGPVVTTDEFTIETVRFYKMIFPGAHIIVSTWDDTANEVIKTIETEGAIIVTNKIFQPCGLGNINYQLCTSLAGIKKAKELGAEYVIKNRSDLRIYKEFTFEYLKVLLDRNPVQSTDVPMKGRIITLDGFGGQLFYTNWLQDFFYFGHTDDVLNFFDVPYDDRDGLARRSSLYLNDKYAGRYSGGIMCQERVPEVYVTTSFLSKYIKVGESLKDAWQYHHDYFMTIDFDAIGAMWYKYNQYTIHSEFAGDNNILDYNKNLNTLTSSAIINSMFEYEPWMEEMRFLKKGGKNAVIDK